MQKIDIIKIYKQKNALVIDDYPDMRGSIRRMLITFGVQEVDTASTGEEAIDKCRERHYDIIVADYNLGDSKNGQQVLEELRYQNLLKHTSLYVMITAETTRTMVFGALEYQPDDYLTKPFTQTVLQRRLDRQVLEREMLNPIYEAMDNLNYDHAIELCNEHIQNKDRYHMKCSRIKGRCLLEKHQLTQAKKLYEDVLEDHPVEWAEIGLGKCLLANNELDRAEELFQGLVDDGCLCLEVYDHLAEIKSRNGDVKTAQKLLQNAIEISPNAILRQRKLANISENNDDWSRAEKAHRKIVRLGMHSCYDSPENYFGLARCISSSIRTAEAKDSKKIKDAEEVLNKVKRRYRDDNEVQIQSDIISANVYADAGKDEEAALRVKDVESRIEEVPMRSAKVHLDMAHMYKSVGKHDKANKILTDLAKKFEHDDEICLAIDRMCDEPITKKGKEQAVKLNRQGKGLFDHHEYQKAIALFSQALQHYPNNIALNLNLLLALVKQMSATEITESMLDRADQAIEKIAHIPPDHELYERFQLLANHAKKLRERSVY